jgi:hypothetical protein
VIALQSSIEGEAAGDGANDVRIDHGNLTALLYPQVFRHEEFGGA